jgi:hypothetical protein
MSFEVAGTEEIREEARQKFPLWFAFVLQYLVDRTEESIAIPCSVKASGR